MPQPEQLNVLFSCCHCLHTSSCKVLTVVTTIHTNSNIIPYQQKLVPANGDVSGSLPSHYSLQDILLCSELILLETLPLSQLP